jgi:hypothetical protein
MKRMCFSQARFVFNFKAKYNKKITSRRTKTGFKRKRRECWFSHRLRSVDARVHYQMMMFCALLAIDVYVCVWFGVRERQALKEVGKRSKALWTPKAPQMKWKV